MLFPKAISIFEFEFSFKDSFNPFISFIFLLSININVFNLLKFLKTSTFSILFPFIYRSVIFLDFSNTLILEILFSLISNIFNFSFPFKATIFSRLLLDKIKRSNSLRFLSASIFLILLYPKSRYFNFVKFSKILISFKLVLAISKTFKFFNVAIFSKLTILYSLLLENLPSLIFNSSNVCIPSIFEKSNVLSFLYEYNFVRSNFFKCFNSLIIFQFNKLGSTIFALSSLLIIVNSSILGNNFNRSKVLTFSSLSLLFPSSSELTNPGPVK